ncbi:EamA family transporter [Nocardioides lijunqiniae]|uniref:EamA family transporter n=1 Tax=Nocardioides lijunqiniae TaxID=2760832 RepID=UPI0018786E41
MPSRVPTRVPPVAPPSPRGGSGYALTVAGVLLWGTLGISGAQAIAHTGMSAVMVSALRLVIAGVLLLPVVVASGELVRTPRTRAVVRRVVVTGVGTAAFACLYLEAIPYLGVATATVVSLGTCPVAVVTATALRRAELPSAGTALGTAAAVLGLVLVCSAPSKEAGRTGSLALGIALAALSGLAFAAVTVLNRSPAPGLRPAPLLALSSIVGAVVSALAAVALGDAAIRGDASGAGWLLFMALVPTVLGYLLFYHGLSRGLPATTASVLSLLEVVSATALAVVFLGERLPPLGVAGLLLVLASAQAVRPSRSRLDAGSPRHGRR